MFFYHHFFSKLRDEQKILWQEGAPVWSALGLIQFFLSSMQHKIEIILHREIFLENRESISIGRGTKIDPGVYIEGPCWIGKDCHIRHGAMIRGGSILNDRCMVGHGTEIKQSILLEDAAATHLCYVGDSILGQGVNLGAGVKCANLRLDRKPIAIQAGGERINTGLRKLGAILGDGVQIGCNCVLNPGTLIGPQSVSQPLMNFGGYIPPRSQVRQERTWVVEPVPEKILEHLLK